MPVPHCLCYCRLIESLEIRKMYVFQYLFFFFSIALVILGSLQLYSKFVITLSIFIKTFVEILRLHLFYRSVWRVMTIYQYWVIWNSNLCNFLYYLRYKSCICFVKFILMFLILLGYFKWHFKSYLPLNGMYIKSYLNHTTLLNTFITSTIFCYIL